MSDTVSKSGMKCMSSTDECSMHVTLSVWKQPTA